MTRTRVEISLPSKKAVRSSAVYRKPSFRGMKQIRLSSGSRLGYSSNVGRMQPTFPQLHSIKALISSAAPLPTRMCCGLTWKFLEASRALTPIPEG